eukprot:GHRR01015578.1.p2 GENE.GHRR01015578.1~~GHRR01015578.1.p2  ORF type:complete len:614 (+),score=290.82 GHRR01015578.1:3672-5513(+)
MLLMLLVLQATAKLKAAEEAASPAERDAAAHEALTTLLRVPQCVDLGQIVPTLAYLRQWEGIAELVARCAAVADPHSLAWRLSSSSDTAAARAARDRCYSHLLEVLKPLLGVGQPLTVAPMGPAAGQGGARSEAQGAPLTPAERKQAKQNMMQAILKSGDQYLITVLYSALVDVGGDEDLLANPSPALELYLRQEGGLAGTHTPGAGGPAALVSGQVGPLSRRQVKHLELLARLHIKKAKYAAAAGIYRALAERRSGPGDAAVSLGQRLDALHNALLQARSVGDEQLIEGLRGSVKVMTLQIAIVDQLKQFAAAVRRAAGTQQGQAAAGAVLPPNITREQLGSQLRELQSSSLDISDLYNAYAQPYELWGICLEICNFAGSVPAEYVRQLWDLLLKQTWEQAGQAATSSGSEADVSLEKCCDKVEALGVKFYPNEGSLPLSHVILRLEAIAAGLWPTQSEPAQDPSRVVRCLRAVLHPAAGDSTSSVLSGIYQQLLAKRGTLLNGGVAGANVVLGGGGGDGSVRTTLKLRLLQSLATHCMIVLEEELNSSLTSQPDHGYPSQFLGRAQQAAALADLAEQCASEARSLGGDAAAAGQQLAEKFDRVAAKLANAQ